ncbi:hypothetical protein JCM5296_001282 [Sporobolomyces johnsonii]
MPTHDPLVLGLPYYIWCIVLDNFGYDSLKVVAQTCKALNSMHQCISAQTELEIHPELLLRPRCACWNLAHIKPASGDAKPSGPCPAALKTDGKMGVTAEQVLLVVKQHINWLSPNPIHVPACTNILGTGHRFYSKWYSTAATGATGPGCKLISTHGCRLHVAHQNIRGASQAGPVLKRTGKIMRG